MDKSKINNRDRWPDLAEKVDQLRSVFGDVKVLNIYEHGRLVAGNPLNFSQGRQGAGKCKCGCIPPFCSCPPDDGQVTTAGCKID